MKPGISLVDLHLLAERIFLEGLMEMGIIHGDIDDMVKSRLGAIFMPFGVGHFVGLDLLDVGGYPKNGPPPRTERGLDGLHTTRNMEAGMVITIEPGLYFNKPLVKDALNDPEFSRFIDEKAIQRFMDFGGVRIEEIVTVTSDGIEVLSCIPRDVDEIERLMAEGRANENPVLRGNLLPNVKA
uniref:Peptidase M24 domain-containing protein n=1 Tax=Ciona savignyi TaxID=51511 RepID=H2ZPX8_CIOSA